MFLLEYPHASHRKTEHRPPGRNGRFGSQRSGGGEYASNSEVIRDALRDWTHKRKLREQGLANLRKAWHEAVADESEGLDADAVFDRLEAKYDRLSPFIPGDLEEIADFIAQDSPRHAAKMLRLLRADEGNRKTAGDLPPATRAWS